MDARTTAVEAERFAQRFEDVGGRLYVKQQTKDAAVLHFKRQTQHILYAIETRRAAPCDGRKGPQAAPFARLLRTVAKRKWKCFVNWHC